MGDWYVEIRERDTGRVERRMGPLSERTAEQVASGARINMSDAYEAVVISPPCPHCGKPGDTERCGVGGCPLGLDL